MDNAVLTSQRIREALAALPGWRHEENALCCAWTFASFAEAVRFMHACIEDIDRLDHHPTWTNSWNRVEVRLTTHDCGHRVTARDIGLAKILSWHAAASGGN